MLIIDEINRGDVARIFGELITFIEEDKREIEFSLSVRSKDDERHMIPRGLHFLGTMNSADKSISMLDIALRRRFALIECPPDPDVFLRDPEWVANVEGIELASLLVGLNRRLDAAGIEADRRIGHALLKIKTTDANPLQTLMDHVQYDIYPLLNEYFFLNRDKLQSVLGNMIDGSGRFLGNTADAEKIVALAKIADIAPVPATSFTVSDLAVPEEDPE